MNENINYRRLFYDSCIDFLNKSKGFQYISDQQSYSVCIINPFFFYQEMVKFCFIPKFDNSNHNISFIRLFAQDFNTNFQLISFGFVSQSNYSKFFELFYNILSNNNNTNNAKNKWFVPEIFFNKLFSTILTY